MNWNQLFSFPSNNEFQINLATYFNKSSQTRNSVLGCSRIFRWRITHNVKNYNIRIFLPKIASISKTKINLMAPSPIHCHKFRIFQSYIFHGIFFLLSQATILYVVLCHKFMKKRKNKFTITLWHWSHCFHLVIWLRNSHFCIYLLRFPIICRW